MVVLFYATMVNLFQHEPFAVIDEYLGETCREYWWTTLLYIQNYWNPNNMVTKIYKMENCVDSKFFSVQFIHGI